MATRSLIGLKNGETVKYVYCHFDGYPSNNGVGTKLARYWNLKKTQELMDRGDLRSLGDDFASCQFFNDIEDEKSGHKIVGLGDYAESQFLKENWDIEYFYLFDNGKWMYKDTRTPEWKEAYREDYM
jgi:hypothetical protein